jgi:hypothetical protein
MNVLPPTAILTSVFSGVSVCADPGAVETAVAQANATIVATVLKTISNSLWRLRVVEFLVHDLRLRRLAGVSL